MIIFSDSENKIPNMHKKLHCQVHKKLFSIVAIVGKLIALNEDSAKQQHACREGIKYFKNYTLKHFAEEESYMRSINYSEYAMHQSLHDNMQNKTLPAF